MKIAYVNGFNGHKSRKPEQLSKMLGVKIRHVKLTFEDTVNLNQVYRELNNIQPDVVIGSSTGAYVARKHCYWENTPLIALNPLINPSHTNLLQEYVNELDDINYNDYCIESLILLNSDDELLDPNEALCALSGRKVMFESGGHRFNNLDEAVIEIEKFLKEIEL